MAVAPEGTREFAVGDRLVCVNHDLPFTPGDLVKVTATNQGGYFDLVVEGELDGNPYSEIVHSCSFRRADTTPAPPADGVSASAILREAADIAAGARSATHGEKERSFQVIGDFWELYLSSRKAGREAPIEPTDVSAMMALLKLGRSLAGKAVRDHFVDGAGYFAIAGELAGV